MKHVYGIALREKPDTEGLNRNDICDLYDMLGGKNVYPVEYYGHSSCAMGFITEEAADKLDCSYQCKSELNDFITGILNDMSLENDDCTYEFHGVFIWLSR